MTEDKAGKSMFALGSSRFWKIGRALRKKLRAITWRRKFVVDFIIIRGLYLDLIYKSVAIVFFSLNFSPISAYKYDAKVSDKSVSREEICPNISRYAI